MKKYLLTFLLISTLLLWLIPCLTCAQVYQAEDQETILKAIVIDTTMNLYNNGDGLLLEHSETGTIQISIKAQSTYGEAELEIITPDGQAQTIILPDSMSIVETVFLVDNAGKWKFIFTNDIYLVVYDRNVYLDFIEFKNMDSKELDVTASWNANIEMDLAGYKIYYGLRSGNYSKKIDVGNIIEYAWSDSWMKNSRYYFVVTAYDTANNESVFSNEVSLIVNSNLVVVNKDSLPPNSPILKSVKIKQDVK